MLSGFFAFCHPLYTLNIKTALLSSLIEHSSKFSLSLQRLLMASGQVYSGLLKGSTWENARQIRTKDFSLDTFGLSSWVPRFLEI